jgi:2-keto-4-pentenoate hydratase/2-oxohepta-3-ene-1,7-dioic acid hydratase in catechol pathway
MKLVSYRSSNGPGYGVVTDAGIVDLTRRLGGKYPDLRALLAGNALDQAAKAANGAGADFQADSLTFLPVIPNPGRIICVGLNYEEHRVEVKRDPTKHPTLFLRVAESQVGHNQPLVRPMESTKFDYEGEIAVIIGKPGRRISEEKTWEHIAGYSCYNEASVRDFQQHTVQWTPGKNFSATGGFGPWMVTADEIPAAMELELTTRLNGQIVQNATTAMMIHSIPVQIAYISLFTTLEPGDVIVTGTPGGVGSRRDPPLWLKPGDKVEVEVSRVGTLINTVVDG